MSVSQHRIPVVSESLVGDKSNKTTTNNNTENNTNNNTNNNSKQESIVTSPSQLNSLLNPSKSSTALSRMDQQQKSVPPGSNISDKHLQSSKVHTSEATNVRNGEGVAADDEEEDEEEDEYSGKPNQTHSDSESMKIDGNVGIRSNQKTPRKRSKVSRACDECRRKKVRCNAILDPNTNEIQKICTNCEKSNDKCTFTRVPLKRGPNKGYNKKNINTSSPNRDPRSRSNSNPNPNSIPNPNPKSIKKSGSISGETNKPLSYLPISNEQNPSRQHFILPPLNSIPFRNPVEQNNQRPYPSSHPHPHPHPHPQQHQQQQQQQPLSPSPQAELYPTQQQIELRQHPQQHSPQQNAVSSNQQGIFWKVPVEMPSFSPEAINSRRRRGSVESISSLSSSGSNKRLMTGKGSFSSNTKSGFGVEASDSEDEFFSNNLNRLSRSNFQVPFKLQHSRRGSVDTNNESNRSSLSSIGSLNLSQSQLQAQPQSPIMPMSGVVLPPQVNDVRERIFTLLDSYYKTLYPQYPLVPPSMVMKNSIQSIIGGSEFSTVIDILHLSLQSVLTLTNSPEGLLHITRAYEIAISIFVSKSAIYSSTSAKIVLTSSLTLLNYAIVLSGYEYSLGFGVAFSFMKDWFVFREGYDSPSFVQLIQLVVLDSLYSLYFGVPRSNTVCFAIDGNFIESFFKEVEFPMDVDIEWVSIGLHLVVLNNKLQEMDTLGKLDSIEVTGTRYKFMAIIKLYYELFTYCQRLNVQQVINEYNSVIDNSTEFSSITEVLEKYIYNVELDISKITKKLTNLIDEQCDDLEITKPNVLISLILVKCYHISTNCEVLVNSLLTLNQMLDLSNNTNSGLNKNTISNNQTPSSTNESTSTRSRSSSINSVNVIRSGSASTQVYSLTDYNHRLLKLRDSIRGNIRRCLAINQTHRHCIEIMSQLERSHKPDINVPRTNSNSEIKYSVVIQSWIRLVNVFLTSEITKEGINGWCYA